MSKSFQEIKQDFVNMDYSQLVKTCKQAIADVLPTLQAYDKENNGALLLTAIVHASIGADGTLSALERRFIKDVLGVDDSFVDTLLRTYTSSVADLTDTLADRISAEGKAAITVIAICFTAVDETINRDENAFLNRLYN